MQLIIRTERFKHLVGGPNAVWTDFKPIFVGEDQSGDLYAVATFVHHAPFRAPFIRMPQQAGEGVPLFGPSA